MNDVQQAISSANFNLYLRSRQVRCSPGSPTGQLYDPKHSVGIVTYRTATVLLGESAAHRQRRPNKVAAWFRQTRIVLASSASPEQYHPDG